ncbi:hypothetical protein DFH08DRAFT_839457 [Mycena albidolilacea]|uniref:Uncharacterized protein n=1 Tax=Mycena albidolilacea TaxID=1033008 RepID=A0AAD7APR2_9AGAR|nr:hypothetical protein DFH08DRAFT_839457 [Mycena albidolilacea]
MASAPSSQFVTGQGMMYHNFTLTVQTFFFGGYSVLILLSTRMLLKRGLKTRPLKVLFVLGLFMYTLSAAFWAYSIAYVVGNMQAYIDPQNEQWLRFSNQVSPPLPLFHAIVLVNFVLSDGIVCWRAWVISRRNYRRYIVFPVAFWIFTIISTTALIVLRIVDIPDASIGPKKAFIRAIDVLQLQNMTTSLLSNISATGLIGTTAWRHRQEMRTSFPERSRVNQVLALLIESGVLYCLTGVLGLVSQLIRLPHGTLNDIWLSDNIQFAGAYAPALLLLISSHQSSDDTEYLGTLPISARPRTVQFAPSEVQHRHFSAIQFGVNSSVETDSTQFGARSGAETVEIEGNVTEKKI